VTVSSAVHLCTTLPPPLKGDLVPRLKLKKMETPASSAENTDYEAVCNNARFLGLHLNLTCTIGNI
jgi:hypothetical protein